MSNLHIHTYHLPDNQYFKSKSKKTTIVLHHTASTYHSRRVIDSWNTNKDKIATAYLIGGLPSNNTDLSQDGIITEAFEPDFWAYHLGVQTSSTNLNIQLNSQAIGIEVCNWGYLTQDRQGNFLNYVGQIIPKEQVEELNVPFRGFKFYHKYTNKQLDSLKQLLIHLSKRFNIDIKKEWNIEAFEINNEALKGSSGLWNHTNYRRDKTDMSPQNELISMLNSL